MTRWPKRPPRRWASGCSRSWSRTRGRSAWCGAWRSAQRLGAPLDLLWVAPPGQPTTAEQEQSLAALRQLASILGAKLFVEESDDVAAAVSDVVNRRGTTYLLMGRSRTPRGLARLRTPLAQRLMETLPAVDARGCRPLAARERAGASVSMVLVAVCALMVGAGGGWLLAPRFRCGAPGGRRGPVNGRPRARKILLPFTGTAISSRALEAAIRLARVEDAVIMPVFLARVPRQLSLDAPLPNQCDGGMQMLEAIEQRSLAEGVDVDSRVARGRTFRHALIRLLEEESFDRIIVPATANPHGGLNGRDLEWMLEDVDSEVLILRAAAGDKARISPERVSGHF